MTVAVLTVPTQVPPNSFVRLQRTSGRPAPVFYDEALTMGPTYGWYYDPSETLYGYTGPYRLVYKAPNGDTGTLAVTVGSDVTDLPDAGAFATVADVQALISSAVASLDTRYAETDGDETISGAWEFDTAPTLADGSPIGAGLSTDEVQALIDTDQADQRDSLDTRYLQLAASDGQTVSTAVDFTVAPKINGTELTDGTAAAGSAATAATAAQAAATAAAASAAAAQATADTASQITGLPGPAGTGLTVVFPLSPLPADFTSGVVFTPRVEVTATTNNTTDVFTATAHGLTAGVPLSVKSGPAPLTATVVPITTSGPFYFVVNPTTDTFQLATTPGGSAINITGSDALVYSP